MRRAVGDDSQAQHSVRPIAGFGYRWVVPTEAIDADEALPEPLPAAAAAGR